MFRSGSKSIPVIFATGLPLYLKDHDKVIETKTAQDFYLRKNDNETGKDRLYRMFSLDELGRVSSELNAVYQAGFLGTFAGVIYGGFLNSRTAYFDFIDNNQATAFKSHLDAKKKLQDNVTMGFAKGAFKWGWRLGLFSLSYVGISTTISVYRGKSSIWEYLSAGILTGSMYKFSMGPKGMVAGGLVGGVFGTVAGVVSLGILKLSGRSMEEVRYWQYKWKLDRYETINEAMKTNTIYEKDVLLEHHNQRFGTENLNLEKAETKEESPAPVSNSIVKKESNVAKEKK